MRPRSPWGGPAPPSSPWRSSRPHSAQTTVRCSPERPYRAWGYPLPPIVFILFALWLVINTAREQPRDTAVGAALILAGLPLYFWRRRQSSVVRHPSTATGDG